MKAKNYLLTIFVGLFMCACNSEDIAEQVEKNNFNSHESVTAEIMSFDNLSSG